MRIQRNKPNLADVDMTPMIDIVFQLIAFFMIVTNFENTKADERVKLPVQDLAKPAEVARQKELMLNVGFIRDQNGVKRSKALLFYAGEQIPILESARVLKREMQIYKDLKTDPQDVTVVIRADRAAPTGLIQELIRLCQEAEFQKFALKLVSLSSQIRSSKSEIRNKSKSCNIQNVRRQQQMTGKFWIFVFREFEFVLCSGFRIGKHEQNSRFASDNRLIMLCS